MIEGRYFVETGTLPELSVQQLIDSTGLEDGCKGGNLSIALDVAAQSDGIVEWKVYPYYSSQQRSDSCKSLPKNVPRWKVSGHRLILRDEDHILEILMEHGPIGIALDGSHLKKALRWDVTDEKVAVSIPTPRRGWAINHAVLLVGAGNTKKGTPSVRKWVRENVPLRLDCCLIPFLFFSFYVPLELLVNQE